MPPPEVSTVITVRDMNPDWLYQAVDSCLAQEGVRQEVILVDDGSENQDTQNCLDELGRHPYIRHVSRPPRGVGPALNTGLRCARAPYVAHLGGDDLMEDGRLAHQRDFLDSHPEVDVLGGDMIHIGPDGDPIERTNYSAWFHVDRNDPTAIAHPTVMARKLSLVKADGYDEIDRPGSDYRLWKRMMESGGYQFEVLERVYAYRRVWPGSYSFSRSDLLSRLHEEWKEAA